MADRQTRQIAINSGPQWVGNISIYYKVYRLFPIIREERNAHFNKCEKVVLVYQKSTEDTKKPEDI